MANYEKKIIDLGLFSENIYKISRKKYFCKEKQN